MKTKQKFKVGQSVNIDGYAVGTDDLQGDIIDCYLEELSGIYCYYIYVKWHGNLNVAEKYLSVSDVPPNTNTLDNLYTILKAMNEIAVKDRSDYFNKYMGEVMQQINERSCEVTWCECANCQKHSNSKKWFLTNLIPPKLKLCQVSYQSRK